MSGLAPLPRLTVVAVDGREALLVWRDGDGYGVEYADGSRAVVDAVTPLRYIDDGEAWA